MDRERHWKLTCQFTFYDLRARVRDSSARCFERLRNLENLLKVREAGTRKPDSYSYARGAIAPRPTEGGGEPRPHPPGTKPPLTRYVSERQAREILEALKYEVMSPEEVWAQPPGSTREAYLIDLADKMRYLLGRPTGTDVRVRG